MSSSSPILDNHIIVDEILHLNDQKEADAIEMRMSQISHEYDALLACDIVVPPFQLSTIPQFSQLEVKTKLIATKTKKTAPDPSGDVLPKIFLTLC